MIVEFIANVFLFLSSLLFLCILIDIGIKKGMFIPIIKFFKKLFTKHQKPVLNVNKQHFHVPSYPYSDKSNAEIKAETVLNLCRANRELMFRNKQLENIINAPYYDVSINCKEYGNDVFISMREYNLKNLHQFIKELIKENANQIELNNEKLNELT